MATARNESSSADPDITKQYLKIFFKGLAIGLRRSYPNFRTVVDYWLETRGVGNKCDDAENVQSQKFYYLRLDLAGNNYPALALRTMASIMLYERDHWRCFDMWDEYFRATQTAGEMWTKLAGMSLVYWHLLDDQADLKKTNNAHNKRLDECLFYLQKSRLADWIFEIKWESVERYFKLSPHLSLKRNPEMNRDMEPFAESLGFPSIESLKFELGKLEKRDKEKKTSALEKEQVHPKVIENRQAIGGPASAEVVKMAASRNESSSADPDITKQYLKIFFSGLALGLRGSYPNFRTVIDYWLETRGLGYKIDSAEHGQSKKFYYLRCALAGNNYSALALRTMASIMLHESNHWRCFDMWDEYFRETQTAGEMWTKLAGMSQVYWHILDDQADLKKSNDAHNKRLDECLFYLQKSRLADWIFENKWESVECYYNLPPHLPLEKNAEMNQDMEPFAEGLGFPSIKFLKSEIPKLEKRDEEKKSSGGPASAEVCEPSPAIPDVSKQYLKIFFKGLAFGLRKSYPNFRTVVEKWLETRGVGFLCDEAEDHQSRKFYSLRLALAGNNYPAVALRTMASIMLFESDYWHCFDMWDEYFRETQTAEEMWTKLAGMSQVYWHMLEDLADLKKSYNDYNQRLDECLFYLQKSCLADWIFENKWQSIECYYKPEQYLKLQVIAKMNQDMELFVKRLGFPSIDSSRFELPKLVKKSEKKVSPAFAKVEVHEKVKENRQAIVESEDKEVLKNLRPFFIALRQGTKLSKPRPQLVNDWMKDRGIDEGRSSTDLTYADKLKYIMNSVNHLLHFDFLKRMIPEMLFKDKCTRFREYDEFWDNLFSQTKSVNDMWLKIAMMLGAHQHIIKLLEDSEEDLQSLNNWMDALLWYFIHSRLAKWIYKNGWDSMCDFASSFEKTYELKHPATFKLKFMMTKNKLIENMGLPIEDVGKKPLGTFRETKNTGNKYEDHIIPGRFVILNSDGMKHISSYFQEKIRAGVMPSYDEIMRLPGAGEHFHTENIVSYLRKLLREKKYQSKCKY